MQRLGTFFKDSRVLSLIGVIALALIIWFGADYVRFGAEAKPLSEMARLVIIMVLLVLWGLNNLRLAQRDKRQNNQLVEGIQSSAAKPGANPADLQISQQEAAAIQERFQDALTRLKQSKFQTSQGSKTLYELPWYIMVGPPGSGKTTAIVNSGLSFPLANTAGGSKVGGVGGTRNCDWWFTNEAVLIDTAGRYTTQDSHATADSQGWQSFLGLLKKYRPRRPINGVVVAISVQDMIVQTKEERSLHAKTIRTRLDELMQQLGMAFPIYVTFTKCDMLAGFSEFFDDMAQAEREQVWGVTFPAQNTASEPYALEYFGGEFDALVERLNKRLLARINQERDPRRRQAIALFPQQFENLKQNLVEFVQETFAPSRYHQQPELRGVYFTSATQQGMPIDRIMASLSASYGLSRDAVAVQEGQGKAYFIGDLLNKVVFPEANTAGINHQYERRLKLMRYGAFAGMGVILLAAIGIWGATVHQNKQLMDQLASKLEEYKTARSAMPESSSNPAESLAALNALKEAAGVYTQVSHPWLTGLGLYDPSVEREAQAAYERALVQVYLPRLEQQIETALANHQAEDDSLFAMLRVYLMLNLKERREPEAIRQWATDYWARGLKGQATTQTQLREHLDRLLEQDFPSLTLNDAVVAKAREQLRRVPIEQRIYAHLKAEMSQPRLELLPVLGSIETPFRLDEPNLFSVPFLYTKAGYEQVDLSKDSPAVKGLTRDRWVMGQADGEDFSEEDLEEIAEKVREIYLNDYANYWMRLLESVAAKPYGGAADAVEKLGTLTDPVYSPMLLLLTAVSENTQLTPEVPNAPAIAGKAGQTADKLVDAVAPKVLPPTVVDKRFRDINYLLQETKGLPAPISRVMAQINGLKNYLSEIALAPEPSAMAFEKAKARFQGGPDPIRDMTLLAKELPKPLDGWLATLAQSGWQATLGGSGQHLSKLWRNDVYGRFSRALAGRYPFDRASRDDAALSDFIEYFKPGGIEQEFFNTYLKPFVNTSGARWTLRNLDRGGVRISNEALAQMQLADQIRRTYFGKGDAPEFAFRLTPIKLDPGVRLFELDLGGQSVRYTHGPKIPIDARWPGAQDSVRILFQDLNETNHSQRYEGEWAFFRLLDQSKVQKSGRANGFLLSFNTGGREAQYELIARSQVNPLNQDLLSRYRAPESL